MDINTFATLLALASAALTVAGAMLFVRWTWMGSEGHIDAEIASLFPMSHC